MGVRVIVLPRIWSRINMCFAALLQIKLFCQDVANRWTSSVPFKGLILGNEQCV